jgi:hypothetical protein
MKMKKLSIEVWECRCGHREIGKEAEEQERGEEEQERRIRSWEEKNKRFGKQATLSYKKVRGTGRKRTSTRGR